MDPIILQKRRGAGGEDDGGGGGRAAGIGGELQAGDVAGRQESTTTLSKDPEHGSPGGPLCTPFATTLTATPIGNTTTTTSATMNEWSSPAYTLSSKSSWSTNSLLSPVEYPSQAAGTAGTRAEGVGGGEGMKRMTMMREEKRVDAREQNVVSNNNIPPPTFQPMTTTDITPPPSANRNNHNNTNLSPELMMMKGTSLPPPPEMQNVASPFVRRRRQSREERGRQPSAISWSDGSGLVPLGKEDGGDGDEERERGRSFQKASASQPSAFGIQVSSPPDVGSSFSTTTVSSRVMESQEYSTTATTTPRSNMNMDYLSPRSEALESPISSYYNSPSSQGKGNATMGKWTATMPATAGAGGTASSIGGSLITSPSMEREKRLDIGWQQREEKGKEQGSRHADDWKLQAKAAPVPRGKQPMVLFNSMPSVVGIYQGRPRTLRRGCPKSKTSGQYGSEMRKPNQSGTSSTTSSNNSSVSSHHANHNNNNNNSLGVREKKRRPRGGGEGNYRTTTSSSASMMVQLLPSQQLPRAAAGFFGVDVGYCCNLKMMRPTMTHIPHDEKMLKKTGIPLGFVLSPLHGPLEEVPSPYGASASTKSGSPFTTSTMPSFSSFRYSNSSSGGGGASSPPNLDGGYNNDNGGGGGNGVGMHQGMPSSSSSFTSSTIGPGGGFDGRSNYYSEHVPVIYGQVPTRCHRCRGYINPHAEFIALGRIWRCPLCTAENEVDDAIFCHLDQNGKREDTNKRAELCRAGVEWDVEHLEEYKLRCDGEDGDGGGVGGWSPGSRKDGSPSSAYYAGGGGGSPGLVGGASVNGGSSGEGGRPCTSSLSQLSPLVGSASMGWRRLVRNTIPSFGGGKGGLNSSSHNSLMRGSLGSAVVGAGDSASGTTLPGSPGFAGPLSRDGSGVWKSSLEGEERGAGDGMSGRYPPFSHASEPTIMTPMLVTSAAMQPTPSQTMAPAIFSSAKNGSGVKEPYSRIAPTLAAPISASTPTPFLECSSLPLTHLFMIDISRYALREFLEDYLEGVREGVDALRRTSPSSPVSFILFASQLHFCDFSNPRFPLHSVPDTNSPFVPLPFENLCWLRAGADTERIESFLQRIPLIAAECMEDGCALGAAVEVGLQVLTRGRQCGGRIFLSAHRFPRDGIGSATPPRECRKYFSDSTFKDLLLPIPQSTWVRWSSAAVAANVSFDLLMFSSVEYCELVTLAELCHQTGGEVHLLHHRPQQRRQRRQGCSTQGGIHTVKGGEVVEEEKGERQEVEEKEEEGDGEKGRKENPPPEFSNPVLLLLRRRCEEEAGYGGILRVRCSPGLRAERYYGHGVSRSPSDLDLAAVTASSNYYVELGYESKLDLSAGGGQKNGVGTAYVQTALLYTTRDGRRRVRVLTFPLTVVQDYKSMYQGLDLEALLYAGGMEGIRRAQRSGLHEGRKFLMDYPKKMVVGYEKYAIPRSDRVSRGASRDTPLFLSQSICLLPMACLSLLKTDFFGLSFRSESASSSPLASYTVPNTSWSTCGVDHRVQFMFRFQSLPMEELMATVYPDLFPLHILASNPSFGEVMVDEEGNCLDSGEIQLPPSRPLTHESVVKGGVYALCDEAASVVYLWIGSLVQPEVAMHLFGVEDVRTLFNKGEPQWGNHNNHNPECNDTPGVKRGENASPIGGGGPGGGGSIPEPQSKAVLSPGLIESAMRGVQMEWEEIRKYFCPSLQQVLEYLLLRFNRMHRLIVLREGSLGEEVFFQQLKEDCAGGPTYSQMLMDLRVAVRSSVL